MKFTSLLTVTGVLLLISFGTGAQTSTTQISGTVSDATGASVPNAAVALTNDSTGVVQRQTTTEAGLFAFPSIPAGAYTVEVVAQQFSWNFHYPGKDGVFGRTDPNLIDDSSLNFVGLDDTDPNAKDDSVVATLAVPANRPVELVLNSKDVTHSFFVPQLRFKQDLVPGMKIHVHFTALKPGKYELACAELCGMNHFKMKAYMLVLPQNEFDELVAMPQEKFQARQGELLNKYQLPTY